MSSPFKLLSIEARYCGFMTGFRGIYLWSAGIVGSPRIIRIIIVTTTPQAMWFKRYGAASKGKQQFCSTSLKPTAVFVQVRVFRCMFECCCVCVRLHASVRANVPGERVMSTAGASLKQPGFTSQEARWSTNIPQSRRKAEAVLCSLVTSPVHVAVGLGHVSQNQQPDLPDST